MNYSPVKQSERIEIIDVFRGLAIFGILMVNMPLMYEPMSQMMLGVVPDASISRIISESFIKFFFEGKFYVIFSMLFGFGFWLFMNKEAGNGRGITPVYFRRLSVLLFFGIAHVIFLWAGDILVFYALFGLILLLFRKSSNRKIIKWSVWLSLLPTIITLSMFLLITLFSQVPEAKEAIDAGIQQGATNIQKLVGQATAIYTSGSYPETIEMRLTEYLNILPAILFFYPVVLGMFLIGFWAARNGVVSNYTENLAFFRKVFCWGLGIGIIANTLYTIAFRYATMSVPSVWSLLTTSMHTFGGISFGLCYISGIVLLFAKGNSLVLSNYLAPAGRMALTNYLSQSLIGAILFLPFGFGLFGKVESWQGIAITVVIVCIQIFFSRWWLGRFRFGPVEWIWRCLTYLKFQPLRRVNGDK